MKKESNPSPPDISCKPPPPTSPPRPLSDTIEPVVMHHVASVKMPLPLSSMEAMNEFIEKAYGKDAVCKEEPKGWIKIWKG